MYLSRLQLNTHNRQVWRQFLRNPYTVHQLVMRGFPDGVKREDGAVLHRLEQSDEAIILLVQSTTAPDWTPVTDYLTPAGPYDFLPNPAVKALNLFFKKGQLLSFRLRANPTGKKGRWDEKTGKALNSNRVPLLKEDQQLDWLKKRAEAGGFAVRHVTISQGRKQKIWKGKGQPPITLYTVQFDGLLAVTDPAKFEAAWQNGVGPSRAFGCGLLSIAPPA